MRRLILILVALMMAGSAQAKEQSYRIAAVVNEEVVTMHDVQERIRLIIGTTGLTDNEDTRKQLYPRVIRALIEETLQMQEAKASNIRISPEEVAAAIASIERQRGKAPGSLKQFLAKNGVPFEAFEQQIRVQIAWNKIVARKIKPRIKITDADVAREIERRRVQRLAGDEVQISSILLPVDSPKDETEARRLAEKLARELKAGSSFDAVAAQLGDQAQNAASIWVSPEDLDPAVAREVNALSKGGISPVIRTAAGFQIVRLGDRRAASTQPEDAEVLLKQILMNLKPDAKDQEVETLLEIAREVSRHPGSCTEESIAGVENLTDLSFDVSLVRTRISAMSSEMVPMVSKLKVGQVSEPFASKEGIRILMLCERSERSRSGVEREKIKAELMGERLSLEALKFLRNLKREAFVEIRM